MKIVEVRFQKAGKVYHFNAAGLQLTMGDQVVVETARGLELGKVLRGPKEVSDSEKNREYKKVLRKATRTDLIKKEQSKEKEQEAFQICKEKIAQSGLEMKLVAAEYAFNGKKLLFYFTADERVDFRELVKELGATFHTRIELRQIGVRDEAKLRGGIAVCGRPLCCSTFLSEFEPVTIKMAKEQNLSLNPGKISGICGRLMCCLANEQESYEELNRSMPKIGDVVTTADGFQGEVWGLNVLRQRVEVLVELAGDEKEVREYPVSELSFPMRDKGRKQEKREKDKEKSSKKK